jgi:lipoprotein-anchoring transpeptidase ErfK/SrfK
VTVDRRIGVRVLAAVLVLTGTFGAVVAVGISHCWGCDRAGSSDQQSAVAPQPIADLVISPGPAATDVDPLGPVTVSASFASVSEVTMTNEEGIRIAGVTTPDGAVWKPAVPLGYGRTYTITATATAPDGARLQRVSTFSTLVPGNQTRVRLTTTSGADVRDGATYGIGTVVVARFDEPIVDKAAAERRLVVSTAPAVIGSWYWLDDQTAHWRPAQYFAPETAVTVQANIYGAALGGGLYGQEDVHVGFVIGDAHVAIADDATKQVSVFNNGQLVRTMPTSMGMGGTERVNGQTISFWTQRGIYTVMDKANPVVMDSSTYGLPINSRLGYRETISWATRISTDGIYLHQLESTVWAQGNTNVSHGCLNLNPDNARWFYDFSQPGDVVEVRNTGGEPLQVWQNGDWSVPWEQWVKGSALR